jgi:spermidine synthase
MKSPAAALAFVSVSVLFFLSGATALGAEVVLAKMLTYVFGSSHLSTATVLAAYMGGLSAGAFIVGRWVARVRRPVLVYGLFEIAVGLFYALLPIVFGPFQSAAIGLARPVAGSPFLLGAVRFSLSFLLVFLPTLMMGGTLPTLVSAFREATLRRRLPVLYAVNTLGAATGTLLASYAAVPALGLDGTLWAAALVNLGIGVVSVVFSFRLRALDPNAPEPAEPPALPGWHLAPRVVFALALTQGALAFVLEVVWFHLIGTVIGVTTYAFAIMLFAILLGIGLGSAVLPIVLRVTKRPPATVFVWAMALFSIGVAVSLRRWDGFAGAVAATEELKKTGHFWDRELVRLRFCLEMLLPTTLAMGIALPALAASIRVEGGKQGAWVGRVFAANTVGTIVGSLFCGFVLLGRLPSHVILTLTVFAALAVGAAALLLGKSPERPSRVEKSLFATVAVASMALAVTFRGWDPYRLTLGTHYYWEPHEPKPVSEVAFLLEDAQSGFITVMRAPDGTKTLRTNGKYEGTDARAEFQDLFALLGGLYVKRYERAALVGLGPGRTLGVLYEMPFRHIEAIEYSPAIIEAAYREFPSFARAAFDDHERVRVVCDDGRNHLQLSPHRYDYIAIAISGAAFNGAGNIYSRDFFRAVRERLADRGVLKLWIQIHHVFPHDVRNVVHTLRSVFPHVHFYADRSRSQGFLFASNDPLTVDPSLVARFDQSEKLARILADHRFSSAIDLVELSVFTTDAELDRYVAALEPPARLLGDLAPAFEYSTPIALAEPIGGYDFEPFSDRRLPPFDPPLPGAQELALQGRRHWVGGDLDRALASLREARDKGSSSQWDALISTLEARVETRH